MPRAQYPRTTWTCADVASGSASRDSSGICRAAQPPMAGNRTQAGKLIPPNP